MRTIEMAFALAAFAVTLSSGCQKRPKTVLENGDFEYGAIGGVPRNWLIPQAIDRAYKVTLSDSAKAQSGKLCVVLSRDSDTASTFGNVMQTFDAKPFRGKRVRFAGFLKYVGSDGGQTQAWLRVDRRSGEPGLFDNMYQRPVQKDAWTAFKIEGLVEDDANTINVGVMLFGKGPAAADNFSFAVLD